MLLEACGFFGLFRLIGKQSGFANAALLFGLTTSLFTWGVFIVGMGMRHIIVHIMQHGLGAGPDAEQDHVALAVTVYTAMAGVHFAFLAVSPIATMFTGIGLASRSEETNIYRLASWGLVLSGLAGIVHFIVIQQLQNVDPHPVCMDVRHTPADKLRMSADRRTGDGPEPLRVHRGGQVRLVAPGRSGL